MQDLWKYNFRVYDSKVHREGNRVGTLLAWLAKQDSDVRPITEIMDQTGRGPYGTHRSTYYTFS